MMTRIRSQVERFIHHPAVELFIVLLIVASVAVLVAEHVVPEGSVAHTTCTIVSDLMIGVFVLELMARYWVARKKSRFFARYWIDIIALLPLARPVRFFRVLRLLRLFRAGMLLNRRLSIFRTTFHGAVQELIVLASLMVTMVLAGALVLFLNERGINEDFSFFGRAVWFSVYSLVGGEPIGGEPMTWLGRLATLGLMLGGLTVFGMFVGTTSAFMLSRLSHRREINEMDMDELVGHVVICGWNRSGPIVVQEVFHGASSSMQAVVIVSEHEGTPEDLPSHGVRPELIYHYHGDYTRPEVLEAVNIGHASAAILLTDATTLRADQDQDARTVLAGLTIERMSPGIFTCAQLHNHDNATLLRMHEVEEIVVGDWYAGVILGSVSRNRGLVSLLNEILTADYGNAFHKAVVPAAHAGKTVEQLHALMKREHSAILMSLEPCRGAEKGQVLVNPSAARKVEEGDTLVVVSEDPVKL